MGAFVFTALVTYASFPLYRKGERILNLNVGYGGMDTRIYFWLRFVMVFSVYAMVMMWAGKFGIRISYRWAWFLYFIIGFTSHLTTWDEREFGTVSWKSMTFIISATLHVTLENMLCVMTFVPRSQAEWYLTRIFIFVFTAGVFTSFVQQKTLITLLGAGGLLAVPADSFTLVAAYGIWKRTTDGKAKFMAIAWGFNTIIVDFWLLPCLTYFGAKDDNYSGLSLLGLIFDYMILCYAVHINIMSSDLADDALEHQLRRRGVMPPDPVADEAFKAGIPMEALMEKGHAGAMPTTTVPMRPIDTSPRTAFLMLLALMGMVALAVMVVPVALGILPLQQLIE